MLSPDRVTDLSPLSRAAADYAIVRRAIAFLSEHWRTQPEIEAVAQAAGVSPSDLHHLFRRWAGITPKAFLQASSFSGFPATWLSSSTRRLGVRACPFGTFCGSLRRAGLRAALFSY